MKRKVALLLMAAMTASALSACSSSSGDATGEASSAAESSTAETTAESTEGSSGASANLTMAWWGNQVRNERTQQIIDLYSEQNPGVTIDGQFSEWSDYWNKLATAAAGDSMPDIVQMDYMYLTQYVENGLLVDLTPYIEDGTIDTSDCNQDVLEAGAIDGKVYALCNGVNAPALVYNKTLLDENGITVKDNMTWDEFVDVCKEIYEKTGYKTNIAYGTNDQWVSYYLRAFDIVLYQEGKLGGDSAEHYIDFFKQYEDGLAEGWVIDPAVFAERTIGSVEQDPLVYGSSPETMSWCSFEWSNMLTSSMAAAPEGMELGMITYPSPDSKKSNYLKPSQFFAISTDSKNPDEAAKILNFITNSLDCNNILLGERGIPLSSSVAEAISDKLDEGSQRAITYINDVVSPNSSKINPPNALGYSEVNDLIKKLQEKVCYGEITAEEAGNQLFEQGNKIMAEAAE